MADKWDNDSDEEESLPMRAGLRLLGLDIPQKAEDKLRIFVALKVVDEKVAATHAGLIVKDSFGDSVKHVIMLLCPLKYVI